MTKKSAGLEPEAPGGGSSVSSEGASAGSKSQERSREVSLPRKGEPGSDSVELRRAQDLLHENEAKLLVTIDEAPICVATVDLTNRFLTCNKAFCSFLGYTEDELKQKTIADITCPGDAEVGMVDLHEILEGRKKCARVQKRYVRKNGDVVWGEVNINLIRDGKGKPLYFLPIIQDITERKRVEKELLDNRDLLNRTGRMGKIGGWEFYVDTLTQVWTEEMFHIFEIDDCQRAPGVWEGVDFCAPSSKAVGEAAVRRAIESGEPYDIEVEIITAKGNHRWARSIGVPIYEKGRVKSISGTFQDITERKQTDDALRESNLALQEAMKQMQEMQKQMIQQERLSALGQMAGGVAHDFNNALVPVLGYTELLLSEPNALDDKKKVVRTLELIRGGAMNAAATVSRLREFYRQGDRSKLVPVDLYRIVGETVAVTRPRWQKDMAAKGVIFDMRTEIAPVPPVLGDESELSQLVSNLMANAVDAMPGGGCLTIRLYSHVSGEHVVIEVQDTGVGMTEEIKRRCLDPFFTTKEGRGVGLGLSMSHGIVRRHRGRIEIQSEIGQGTKMLVHLPKMESRAAAVRANADTGRQAGGLRPAGPPREVLFVDDEESARLVVEQYLIADGHKVQVAADGMAGLSKFTEGRFDVVILDRAMPGMNGDRLAAAIKALSPGTPIIMLTGYGDMMNEQGERPAGIDMILTKPFTRESLRHAMDEVMSAWRKTG